MKARIDGTEIFFDVEGCGFKVGPESLLEKPCSVVLHGGPAMDHSYFRPWLSPLAEELQLIYVDHRGTGRSAKVPLETCSIERMADDVEGLRECLGIDKWIVMGHSFGGMWALTYAIRYPKSLTHLILIDTTPSWRENWEEAKKMAEKMGTPDQKRVYKDPHEGRVTTEEENRNWWEIMMSLYLHHCDPQTARAIVSRGKGCMQVGRYMDRNVMPNFDVRERLKEIAIPTLIVAGKYDWITPTTQSELMARSIPNSKMIVFENSSHFPFIEEQQLFITTVQTFLNERYQDAQELRSSLT